MEHRARKRFGQHFLHDRGIIQRILAALDPRPGDTIVEIGPGLGALTRPLLEHCSPLHVVELDRDLAARLRAEFPPERLVVHEADALKFDFCALAAAGKRLRIIGNLPYNISTPLLFHLLDQEACVSDMLFMLQKEVVERMAAATGSKDYGRLSVMIQWRLRVEKLFDVRPGAFTPPPKVDSAVVRLTPHAVSPVAVDDGEIFARVVRAAFSQRRKTLRNTLKGLLPAEDMQRLGIDPMRRAETLSLAEFVRLANALAASA
jgi:16S rRNA (adenine1518-N6/adenine1519-N6)-dimethyltransferase